MQAVLFDPDGPSSTRTICCSPRFATRRARCCARLSPTSVSWPRWDSPSTPRCGISRMIRAVHEELCRVYREYNAEVHDDMIRLSDGTVPMLERLKEGFVSWPWSRRNDTRWLRGLDLFWPDRYFRLPHRLRRLAGALAASRPCGARLRTAGAGSSDVPVRGRQSLRHAVGKRRGLRHRGGAMGYVPSDRA